MGHGRTTTEGEQLTRLLSWGIRFFLTAALTASRLEGGGVPFALGCAAASGPGGSGMAALLGAALGAMLFLDFDEALAFMASAILIYTTEAAFRGTRLLARPGVLPFAAGGLVLTVEGIYLVQSSTPLDLAGPCLAAAVLTGLSARAFRPLLWPGEERPDPDGLLFLTIALLLAAEELEVGIVSVGRTLLGAVVLCAAYLRGPVTGGCAGLCAGLGADLAGPAEGLLCTAVWSAAGLITGFRTDGRRMAAAGTFLLTAAAVLLPVRAEGGTALLLEAALAALLVLLLPRKLFGGKRLKRTAPEPGGAMEALRTRLDRAAAAFRELYESMDRTGSAGDENPAIIFDRSAEKVCRSCALCSLCWQREYSGTFQAMHDALPFLLDRGRALPKDFPQSFRDRCIHMPELLTAVNGELSAFLLRRRYRRELEATRSTARGQYAQLSELLTATAAGLGETRQTSAAAERCAIGAVLHPKAGETVCGDTLASFETEEGLLCLLLSDGMGSGPAAQRESALTCRLMRQFLEAGIQPEAALKTLNMAMALRGAETGSFTTVDLLTCRSGTGETAIYKFGAAPSYIKRGGTVRRITGGTLPAGLRESPNAPDVTRLTLEGGSFAVLISDGVADSQGDEWLLDLLAGWTGEDPQRLATEILTESLRRGGCADDCGVQVLYRMAALPEPV